MPDGCDGMEQVGDGARKLGLQERSRRPPSISSTVSGVGQSFTKATHQIALKRRLRDGVGVDEASRLAELLPERQNVLRDQAW